jgi:RNA-binding protein YhbY
MSYTEMQLGKNGITENFISTLKSNFQTHENVRISVLKSAGHEKGKVREYSDEILDKLGKNYTAKLIGFKIILKKWRKARR